MKAAEVLSGCNPRERSFGKVKKDSALALKYWGMAANEPHKKAEGMFQLGLAAFYGVSDSVGLFFIFIFFFLIVYYFSFLLSYFFFFFRC